MLRKVSVKDNVNRQGVHLILCSFIILFILGNKMTSWQELVILPTEAQQPLDMQHVHVYERNDLRMIQSDTNKNPGQFA